MTSESVQQGWDGDRHDAAAVGDLRQAALAAHEAGLCVIPAANNGSKRPYPDRGEWHEYTEHRPTESQLLAWFGGDRYTGMGIVGGAVSDNVEMFEFEGRAVEEGKWDEFLIACEATGVGDVISHVTQGYRERSPSGGYHLLYRCDAVSGSTKLAMRPATPDELAENPDDRYKTLIETRGEGGFGIVAPSNGSTHPTGKSWELQSGGFDRIATISAEQREALHELARTFDQSPIPKWNDRAAAEISGRPGDDFNDRVDIDDVVVPALRAAGWLPIGTIRRDGNEYWRRPGKDRDHSGTLHRGKRVFYVHSTSTGFPDAPRGYSMFATLAFVRFGGKFSEAASWCRAEGFGADDSEQRIEAHLSSLASQSSASGPDDWPKLDPNALHGLVGEFVRAADPYTEADMAGVLIATLVMAGTAIGRKPHMMTGNARHACNLFAVMVGRTAKGRKGTAEDVARAVMSNCIHRARILGGFGSGEKVVDDLRDDANGGDHRLLVLEAEYARVMSVNAREASILSPILRQLWDGKPVQARSRAKTSEAVDHHVGLLGESTLDELRLKLSDNDTYNGFSNRHLWLVVKRSKERADGGNVPDDVLQRHGERIGNRITWANALPDKTVILGDSRAAALWAEQYHELIEDDPPGRLGSAISRSSSQVLRLSLLYALLDGEQAVYSVHIEAAMALWAYCRASANIIFGNVMDPLAEKVLVALRVREPLNGAELHACLGRHAKAKQLAAALDDLCHRGLIEIDHEQTGGRPRLIVKLANKANKDP